MRTYKFKTLRGLYRAAYGQLTAEALFKGYVYIDATMKGAPYPVYLLVENMKFDRLS